MIKRGKFIVVDGCEGAGKTTMIKILAQEFKGERILFTHDPGGTPFAESVRELVLGASGSGVSSKTLFGLFWGARSDKIEKMIMPNIKSGYFVVSDRFDSSTFAYQVFGEQNMNLRELFWQTRGVFLKDSKPDLYIFLDVDPKIGLQRVIERKGMFTHFDKRDLSFHERVRKGFVEFLKQVPHKTIDANRSIEEVKKDFIFLIKDVLSGHVEKRS